MDGNTVKMHNYIGCGVLTYILALRRVRLEHGQFEVTLGHRKSHVLKETEFKVDVCILGAF